MGPSPQVTSAALDIAEWIRLGLEALGVLTIASGALVAGATAARSIHRVRQLDFMATRLQLARYLALALEIQLAADVIETAISPDWMKIGHLAAIGAIRTALNYFLDRDMHAADAPRDHGSLPLGIPQRGSGAR